jgi:glycosyltransferase involved in cell wall biosynthesis
MMLSVVAKRNQEGYGRVVAVVGQHELDYPRNVVNQRLIGMAGYTIALCHSRVPGFPRTLSILRQFSRVSRRSSVVFATEGSHRHLLFLRLVTLVTGHAIVFDPFISLYNTEVEDRKLHAPRSLKGQVARFRDFCSCWCASYLIFDTHEHKDYFFGRYRIDKPYRILPVGVDERVFRPRPSVARPANEPCDVLFYGTYIPLQGIDVILAAARHLRDDDSIRFTLIGNGQERSRIDALAHHYQLPNVVFVDRLAPEELAERIARADVCLGIFDAGLKASQVVPNKVVQCAAMQKAIVTRESPAIARYFAHEESALLVPPADAVALAAAIARLAGDAALRSALAVEARAVFERHFSCEAQAPIMATLLGEAARAHRRGQRP